MMIRDMAKQKREAEEPAELGPGGAETLSDNECALLARHGNRLAQSQLVHRYTPGVFNLFVRCLEDREAATDATQEVFLRVFGGLHDFDPCRSFRAWLFSIAWNFARDQLRRRASFRKAREGTVSLASGRIARKGDEAGALDPVDRKGYTPLDALERKERSELVRGALSRLDPRQRALLLLREFEGLSYEEISELFGSRIGTIKSGIHRARLELKNILLALLPRTFEERDGKGASSEV